MHSKDSLLDRTDYTKFVVSTRLASYKPFIYPLFLIFLYVFISGIYIGIAVAVVVVLVLIVIVAIIYVR